MASHPVTSLFCVDGNAEENHTKKVRLLIKALQAFASRTLRQRVRDLVKRKLRHLVILPEEQVKQEIMKITRTKLGMLGDSREFGVCFDRYAL